MSMLMGEREFEWLVIPRAYFGENGVLDGYSP